MAILTQSAAELGIRVLNTTADFRLRTHRDKVAARRYFEKAMVQKGEPATVTIDKSGSNLTCLDILIATEPVEALRGTGKFCHEIGLIG